MNTCDNFNHYISFPTRGLLASLLSGVIGGANARLEWEYELVLEWLLP